MTPWLLVVPLLLTGCASMFSGANEQLLIRAKPGTRFSITNSFGESLGSGTSPDTVALPRGAGYFKPQSYRVKFNPGSPEEKSIDIVPGMNPWFFGNILLGGAVGMLIVDPLTGAMYKLHPNVIYPNDLLPQSKEVSE